MMGGHAFARALRAQILSFTALGVNLINFTSPTDACSDFFKKYFEKWETAEPPKIGDFNSEPFMRHLNTELWRNFTKIEKHGPTAKLWIQYMKCILLALNFLEAERLANWKMYLQSIKSMLQIFHAGGHFLYAKSTQLFLQDLTDLETKMDPIEFDKFTKKKVFFQYGIATNRFQDFLQTWS